MPNYDYRCDDCKAAFTVERSMMDTSQQGCTVCGHEKASRIWTVVVSLTGGSTMDYGQGTRSTSSSSSSASATTGSIEGSKSACGSCVSKACGTCH